MSYYSTYQVADSLTIKASFKKEEESQKKLELIEEVDDPIILPKPKKKYVSKIKSDSAEQVDAFYGIKNEGEIPIRNSELKPIIESPIKTLYSPTELVTDIASWQTIVLITAILLLGLSKAFSNNRFKQSIKAVFNYSVAQEITREEKVFFHRSNILLIVVHTLTLSLFLYSIKELINDSYLNTNNILFFLLIIGFLIIVYTVKYIFSKILFFILDDISIASEYIFNVSLHNNLLGIMLIPILCISYFLPLSSLSIAPYMAVTLIFLTYLLRLIRLSVIGSQNGISYFYIFLYICTLEILPLVVLLWIFILK